MVGGDPDLPGWGGVKVQQHHHAMCIAWWCCWTLTPPQPGRSGSPPTIAKKETGWWKRTATLRIAPSYPAIHPESRSSDMLGVFNTAGGRIVAVDAATSKSRPINSDQ